MAMESIRHERRLTKETSLLSSGIFTVAETAYLVGVSQRRVRGWVEGYRNNAKGPH